MKKLLLALTTAATLSACASTPKAVPLAPVAVTAPTPVYAAPTQEVAEAPLAAPVMDMYAPIPGSAEDFAYRAGGESRVYFDYNQYRLSVAAIDALRMQADWLKQYDNVTAVVEGHADERGTREYNLALAARRADSVRSYLVGQGVSPSRLTTVSYGKERPIDGRASEEGWARNRNGNTNLMSGTVG